LSRARVFLPFVRLWIKIRLPLNQGLISEFSCDWLSFPIVLSHVLFFAAWIIPLEPFRCLRFSSGNWLFPGHLVFPLWEAQFPRVPLGFFFFLTYTSGVPLPPGVPHTLPRIVPQIPFSASFLLLVLTCAILLFLHGSNCTILFIRFSVPFVVPEIPHSQFSSLCGARSQQPQPRLPMKNLPFEPCVRLL